MAPSNYLHLCSSDILRLIVSRLLESLDKQYHSDPIEGVRQLTQCLAASHLLREHMLPVFGTAICIDLSLRERSRTNLPLLAEYHGKGVAPSRVLVKIRPNIERLCEELEEAGLGSRPWPSVKICTLYGCNANSRLESAGLAVSDLELQQYLGTALPNLTDISSIGVQSVFPNLVLAQPHMRGTTHHIWGCRIAHQAELSRLVLRQPLMDRGQASQLTKLVAASLVSLDLHNLHPSIGLSRLFAMTGTRERVKFQNLKDLRLHFRWISSHQAINCGDGFCAPLFPNLQTLVLDPSEYEFTDFLLLFAPAPTFRLEISYSERSMQFDIMPFASLRQLNVALRSGYSDRYPYNPAEFLNWILSSNPHLTSLEVSFAHMYVVSVPGRIRCKRLRRLKIGRASFPVDQILEILSKLTELQVLCICVHDSTTGPNKSQCLVPLDTMLQSLEVTAVRAAACAGIIRIASRIPSLVKLVMDI